MIAVPAGRYPLGAARDDEAVAIARSLSDRGDMAYMIQGIRTDPFGASFHPPPTPAFSGPTLAVYGTPSVAGLARRLSERCAFRIAIAH